MFMLLLAAHRILDLLIFVPRLFGMLPQEVFKVDPPLRLVVSHPPLDLLGWIGTELSFVSCGFASCNGIQSSLDFARLKKILLNCFNSACLV